MFATLTRSAPPLPSPVTVRLTVLVEPEVLEAARVLLEVEHLVAAEPPAGVLAHAGHGRVDVDEAVGVRVRQRAQDDGVEHGVDRGRGAEA